MKWLAAIAVAVAAVACSLDESGLLAPDGSALDGAADAPHDGGVVDNYVPPVCSTLDASCLGALPSGWEPFAMQVGTSSVTCPGDGGQFTETAYQANPTVTGNSCVCTPCGLATGWDCSGTLTGGMANCNGASQAVGSAAYCWVQNGDHAGGTVTRTGTATCSPSTYYATDASATAVAGCAPAPTACDVDFCGMTNLGFKLCARNSAQTDGGCPSSLPNSYLVGTNPHAICNACPTCTVSNPNDQCSATITGYMQNDCKTGLIGTGFLNNGCLGPSPKFASLQYTPTVPVPTCAPTGPTNVGGTGAVDGPLTVCCAN
jgi:hypothetical protein